MSLNSLVGLERLPFFFPKFAREHLDSEHTYLINKIYDFFTLSSEVLCGSNDKFTHLTRLLTILPETAVSNFDIARHIIIHIWRILICSHITRCQRQKLAEILTTRLNLLKANYCAHSWIYQSAQSHFVSEEQLTELGQNIDWKALFEMIHERYTKRGFMGPIDISNTKRQACVNSIIRLVSACRFLWKGLSVGDELKALLNVDFSLFVDDGQFHYSLRLMVLFSSAQFWHRLIVSGQLVKWWLTLCNLSSSTWDTLFSKILCLAVHYGWAKGLPLLEICQPFRQLIFQLLTDSLSLPVTSTVQTSFVKEVVPNEINRISVVPQGAYHKLAKVIVLLLEPLDGPVNIGSENSEVFDAETSALLNLTCRTQKSPCVWDSLKTLVGVFLPLTHPGDPEKWTVSIARFVSSFVTEYTHRVARERMSSDIVHFRVGRFYADSTVYSYRLGLREDKEIIDIFLPLVLQGVYSKSLNACTAYESAVKHLCHLNPSLTLPIVSEQVLPALETVTESHRVQSALRLLTQLCHLLLQRMPEVISPLLNLTLRGIDASDPSKSVQVFTFYAVFFSHAKVADCSALNIQGIPLKSLSEYICNFYFPPKNKGSPLVSWQNYPAETVFHKTTKRKSVTESGKQLSNEDNSYFSDSESPKYFWSPSQIESRLSSVIVASSIIPNWVTNFFSQVLYLSVHSIKVEKRLRSIMSSVDRSLLISLKFCLMQLLLNCDKTLFISLCEMFRDWLFQNVHPDATDMVSLICCSFAQSHSKLALNILLKPIYEKILNFMEGKKDISSILPNSSDEKSLTWFMKCLTNLLRAGPGNLYPYRKEIVRIISLTLCHANKKVAQFGLKCIRRTVESCCIITLDLRQNPKSRHGFESPILDSIIHWGTPWWLSYKSDLEDILNRSIKNADDLPEEFQERFSVKWIIPEENDLLFAEYLVLLGMKYIKILNSYSLLKLDGLCDLNFDNPDTNSQFFLHQNYSATQLAQVLDLPFISSITFDPQSFQFLPRQSIQRMLSICRQIIKALGCINPDDRLQKCDDLPIVFPSALNLVTPVVRVLESICLSVCRVYLGIHIDQTTYEISYFTSLVEMRGTEDSVLIRKLLKAMRQMLLRGGCYWNVYGETAMTNKLWNTLNSYMSSTLGIHRFSKNQDLSYNAFAEQLLRQWFLRVELRRSSHPFTGYRRLLIVLTAHFGTYFYSQNRALAQEILKNTFLRVYGGRHVILEMLTTNLEREISQLNAQKCSKEAPASVQGSCNNSLCVPTLPPVSQSSPQLTQLQDSTTNYQIQASSDKSKIELACVRITGITYILNCPSMLLRLWRNPESVKNALLVICQCFDAPIVQPQVQSRLFSLAHSILQSREAFYCGTELHRKYIAQDLISKLLNGLRNHSSMNWRYQLVGTCFLAVLNSPYVKETEVEYSNWIWEACNSSKYFPLLNAVALFSLTLYLNEKLSSFSPSIPGSPQVYDFPTCIQDALLSSKTISIIASSLIHVHHENCSTTSSYPETVYQLVLQVLEFDKTWPLTRFPRHSHYLSLHNCLTVSTIVRAQKLLACSENISTVLESWLTHLNEFLKYPSAEKEYHVTCCEIIGGILNSANGWESKAFDQCWTILHKDLVSLFYTLDQERFLDFLDALRYASDLTLLCPGSASVETNTNRFWVPLMNFAMSLKQQPLCTTEIIKYDSFDFNKSITAGRSTLDDTKRLKLISFIIQQCKWQSNPLVQCLLPVVPSTLLHPYNQIRSELAKCLSFILHLFSQLVESSYPSEEKEVNATYSELEALLIESGVQFMPYFRDCREHDSYQSLNAQRPEAVLVTETLMTMTTHFFQNRLDLFIPDCFIKLLPLFFEALKYSDPYFNDVGNLALTYIALRFGGQEKSLKSFTLQQEVPVKDPLQLFLEELNVQLNSFSWKTRAFVMRLAQIVGEKYRMKLYKTDKFNMLMEICIHGLTDPQSEVREAAYRSLSTLSLSNSSTDYLTYANRFERLAKQSSSDVNLIGGVMGLAALVQSAPYHIPDWLPSTIMRLARFGGHRSSDHVRRHVEKSLQEFFKTHCDAWNQSHVDKFSSSEIELLNAYKGRPYYFS